MKWVAETFKSAAELFKQVDRTILIPLVSFLALIIKQIFHIEIPQETIDASVDGVLALFVFAGILIDFKAKKAKRGGKKKKQPEETPPI